MATDYKDWIAERANDLAQERYNKDYYGLPDNIQMELWARAEADYTDYYAARIDAAYDAAQEAELLRQSELA